MIFKRREKASFTGRVREFIAPRKGFWRGLDYISKRMRRLPDSPHRIALGFACGAVASFTPFFGFHFFVAAGFAWLVRGNVLSSLFGTIVGNPITFPLISGFSLYLGRLILGRGEGGSDFEAITTAFAAAFNDIWSTVKSWFGYGPSMLDGLIAFFWDVFLPYLIGGMVPGLISGIIFYALLGPLVAAYQERRRKKIQRAQAEQRALADQEADAYREQDGV
ncbi:MAG: DUF2062 domain-containing protein [Pseudomonadota bacterium]